jgi:hypothetical protein
MDEVLEIALGKQVVSKPPRPKKLPKEEMQ